MAASRTRLGKDDGGSQPTDDGGSQPTDQATEPTGAVEGIVGVPAVSAPPTDTVMAAAPSAAPLQGWRIVLILVAAAIVGALSASRPTRARRRA